MEAVFWVVSGVLIGLCALGVVASSWLRRHRAEMHGRRMGLVNACVSMAGKGQYAFNEIYSQVIFVNEPRDLILVAKWAGATVQTEPVRADEIIAASLESDFANRNAVIPVLKTLKIERTAGKSDVLFGFESEEISRQWHDIVQSIAAKAGSGHVTMQA